LGLSLFWEQSRKGMSRFGDPRPLTLRNLGGGSLDREATIDRWESPFQDHGFRGSGMFRRFLAVLVETSSAEVVEAHAALKHPRKRCAEGSSRSFRTSMKTCGSSSVGQRMQISRLGSRKGARLGLLRWKALRARERFFTILRAARGEEGRARRAHVRPAKLTEESGRKHVEESV